MKIDLLDDIYTHFEKLACKEDKSVDIFLNTFLSEYIKKSNKELRRPLDRQYDNIIFLFTYQFSNLLIDYVFDETELKIINILSYLSSWSNLRIQNILDLGFTKSDRFYTWEKNCFYIYTDEVGKRCYVIQLPYSYSVTKGFCSLVKYCN